jgi:tetratricopeptide (TPR) repeat protein
METGIMHNPSLGKTIKKTTLTISFILCFFSFSFTAEPALSAADNRGSDIPAKKKGTSVLKTDSQADIAARKEEDLSVLQREARSYRNEGLEYQRIGNLDAAISLYQKAIELDPQYAVVYNDLGVTYEEAGMPERAEECYLKASRVDENFLSPYSNLALLYESERDFDRAAFYWRKRAELGSPFDPWTKKAKQRLSDIMMVHTGAPLSSREQAIFGLIKDVQSQKAVYRGNEQEVAKAHFQKAKARYEKGDEVGALSEALDAQQLDSSNKEINEFIDEVQTKLLTR